MKGVSILERHLLLLSIDIAKNKIMTVTRTELCYDWLDL